MNGRIIREYFDGDRISDPVPGLPVSPIDGYEYSLEEVSLGTIDKKDATGWSSRLVTIAERNPQ